MKKSAPAKLWTVPVLTAVLVTLLVIVTLLLRPGTLSQQQTQSLGDVTPSLLSTKNISLPAPVFKSSNSIEYTIKNRRTRRDFLDKELTMNQVSQMLWAAQGVTVDWGGRSTPSAKSTYPLSVYLIANKVSGLTAGQYQYIPGDRTPVHELKPIKEADLQKAIFEALNESSFKSAPAILVIAGNMGKMAEAYGGIPHDKEVYLEAGHAGQNLYLQAESLKLGLVTISGFETTKLKDLITIPASEIIIYLVPFGLPKQ